MTRLLAFGDLHLEARRTHEREPGDGLRDQVDVLEKIGDLAIENNVDVVVNAGDTVEGPTLTPAAVIAFADFVERMREHDIPVITILGNGRHDLATREAHALRVIDYLPGVDAYDRPELRVIDGTTLCLLPWVHPGRLVAARDGGDRDEVHADAAQLLLRAARDLRDAAPTEQKVLVFHGSIEGASLPTGIAIDEHASDILPVDQLADLGFDAVIASHIHVPQSWDGAVWVPATVFPHVAPLVAPIFYTGSPLPLNFGEGGYEHGVWLLELGARPQFTQPPDGTGDPHHPKVEDQGLVHASASFLPISGRRFVTVDVDLTHDQPESLGLDETDAVAAAIATHLPIDGDIVRVRIRGTEEQTHRVDAAALRTLLADAHKAYIAFDMIRGQRARVDEIDEEIAPLDAVALYAQAHDLTDDDTSALRDVTAGYLDRLGVSA